MKTQTQDTLKWIRQGDVFLIGAYRYKAKSDAVPCGRGYVSVVTNNGVVELPGKTPVAFVFAA